MEVYYSHNPKIMRSEGMINIDKELFRKTEGKLYRYYSKDKHEKSLKEKVNLLNNQIEAINKELRECDINLEPESKSPSFDERVQTSSDGMSYAEREAMRVTELKIRRVTQKRIERQHILEQLDNLEIESNEIEWKIRDFNGELKQILELKYKEGLNEIKIAHKMHLDQSQVNRRKRQMINKIVMWDMWNDSIKNA